MLETKRMVGWPYYMNNYKVIKWTGLFSCVPSSIGNYISWINDVHVCKLTYKGFKHTLRSCLSSEVELNTNCDY